MPWIIDGKCVYKENEDGSKGELVKCHKTVNDAKNHLKALYANVEETLAEFSMFIHKATRDKATGEMRLHLVNSDTGEDVFGEKTSIDLFNDFVYRSDNNLPVPEPFFDIIKKSENDYWSGGKPYLSISHYKSGGGKNVPGEQEKLYIDGEKLKSVDLLWETPLGKSVWKSVYNDLYSEEKEYDSPVRVSIGFLDLEHKHEIEGEEDYIFTRKSLDDICPMCASGQGGKVYLKGHLVHKAFTRVPANTRTSVEVLDMKSKINSKKDDAKSIVKELATDLEEKSAVDDILVTRSDSDLESYAMSVRMAFLDTYNPAFPMLHVNSVLKDSVIVVEYSSPTDTFGKMYKVKYQELEENNSFGFDERSAWEEVSLGYVPVKTIENKSIDDWAINFSKSGDILNLGTEVNTMNTKLENPSDNVSIDKAVTTTGTTATVPVDSAPQVVEEKTNISLLDNAFSELGNKVLELKSSGKYGEDALREIQPLFNAFGDVIKNEFSAPGNSGLDIAATIKSTISEIIPTLKQEIVTQLVSELKGLVGQQPITTSSVVSSPRSISLNVPQLSTQAQQKKSQLEMIASKSVGL